MLRILLRAFGKGKTKTNLAVTLVCRDRLARRITTKEAIYILGIVNPPNIYILYYIVGIYISSLTLQRVYKGG